MSDAPRTLDELIEHYLELGPAWLSEPPDRLAAQISAICGSKELAEAFVYALWNQTYITRAALGYLDLHGNERGLPRYSEESDADYLLRIRDIEDQVTVPAILDAINKILVVPEATLVEWLFGSAWAFDEASFGPPAIFSSPKRGFSDVSLAGSEQPGFTVYIPNQFPASHERSFPGQMPYATDAEAGYFSADPALDQTSSPTVKMGFAEDTDLTPSDIYGRIEDIIRRLKAAGVEHRVEVTGVPLPPIPPEAEVGVFEQSSVWKSGVFNTTNDFVWEKITSWGVQEDNAAIWDNITDEWDLTPTPHPSGAEAARMIGIVRFNNVNKDAQQIAVGIGVDGQDPNTQGDWIVSGVVVEEKAAASVAGLQIITPWLAMGKKYSLWVLVSVAADIDIDILGTAFTCELLKT